MQSNSLVALRWTCPAGWCLSLDEETRLAEHTQEGPDEHLYELLQHGFVHVRECPSCHAKDLVSFLDISSSGLFSFHVFWYNHSFSSFSSVTWESAVLHRWFLLPKWRTRHFSRLNFSCQMSLESTLPLTLVSSEGEVFLVLRGRSFMYKVNKEMYTTCIAPGPRQRPPDSMPTSQWSHSRLSRCPTAWWQFSAGSPLFLGGRAPVLLRPCSECNSVVESLVCPSS